MPEKVLALYDFASKQEYIYRTSKIKEISGASALLEGMYRTFAQKTGICYDLDSQFDENNINIGEVLYDGGGNLMVLWNSFNDYKEANKDFSKYLLEKAPGLTLITSFVECSGNFENDRKKLYEKNRERKNRFPAYDMPAVMPFTQIDSTTFSPVTYKRSKGDSNSVYPAFECSLSSDRYAKAKECGKDDMPEDRMLAVIYIDGNSMGKKLIACKDENYKTGVDKLRAFSKQVRENYVDSPCRIIESKFKVRRVIGGGDEITLICQAEDAYKIMSLYFDLLKACKLDLSGQEFDCTSCAGIAVFHEKSPFNVAYNIAEASCEQAKKKAHEKDGNYFSFYFCHSGITNEFDILHEREQGHASGKPYSYDTDTVRIGEIQKRLIAAGRSNVKTLHDAAQQSLQKYKFEVERINAYLKKDDPKFEGTEEEMRMVYDMAEFYDLWFKEAK